MRKKRRLWENNWAFGVVSSQSPPQLLLLLQKKTNLPLDPNKLLFFSSQKQTNGRYFPFFCFGQRKGIYREREREREGKETQARRSRCVCACTGVVFVGWSPYVLVTCTKTRSPHSLSLSSLCLSLLSFFLSLFPHERNDETISGRAFFFLVVVAKSAPSGVIHVPLFSKPWWSRLNI